MTHGSDLRLAPSLGPVVRQTGASVRRVVARFAAGGFSAVQLDAALRGLRPREMSASARNDLRGVLRRAGLEVAGLDLFIPRKHYLQVDRVDQAISATIEAITLAADLGRVPVSLTLPIDGMAEDLVKAVISAADAVGTAVAVHGQGRIDQLRSWLEQMDCPLLGAAVDPAALLAAGHDPPGKVQQLGKKLLVARLSDLQPGEDEAAGGVRCVPGQGQLDLMRYRVACDLAPNRRGPVVLDLQSLPEPITAAEAARQAWEEAGFLAG